MSPFAEIDKKIITEEYVFTFGQYKGETVDYVLGIDPSYVEWCSENISWFDIDVFVQERIVENEFSDNVKRIFRDDSTYDFLYD